MTDSIFLKDNADFSMFGNQHILAVLFFLVLGFIIIKWAQKLSEIQQIKIGNIFALTLSITVLIWTFLKIYLHGFDIQQDLPFHLCNFIALLLPIFSYTRKKILYDILFFWILAGTSHSLITPDLRNGFPNFVFFKYWIVHAGLVLFMLYATFVYGMKPTFKSAIISFLAFQGYIVAMVLINFVIGANYLYTNHKPEGATAMDYLGDWPTYIFVIELFMIPYFLLFYLPFYLTKKKIKLK